MKKIAFLSIILLLNFHLFSQSYRMTWGGQLKLKKGTVDLDIISADNTGMYFTEERVNKNNFVIMSTLTPTVKLYKIDKNFLEVFDKDYKKELKGLSFDSFQPLGDNLYLFATDYEKKGKLFKIYGAKVDKISGELTGDFKELASFGLESKKDDYEMKISPIENGKSFLMVSNISGKERVAIGVSILDQSLTSKENTVLTFNYNPDEYSLSDIKYTKNKKIIVLGKHYELVETKKKKKKRAVFKEYQMAIYNGEGEKEKDVPLVANGKYVIGGQMVEKNDGSILLAGFYSNTPTKRGLNGFFVNNVDVNSGQLLISSFSEVSADMLGKPYEDESDEDDEDKSSKSKKAKKEKDDDDDDDEDTEIPNDFIIRSVDINEADQSIIFTSEIATVAVKTRTRMERVGNSTRWVTETYYDFDNKDILVAKADKDGKINWVNILPKSQHEYIYSSRSGSGLYYDMHGYFAKAGGMPFYSGFTSGLINNKLIIIMNDHLSNNVNPAYGDKVKTVYNFKKKSNIYGIAIDLETGKMQRKFIGNNSPEACLTPRHAMLVKNEFYIPSYRYHVIGKSDLKFAKLTIR
jgi:hypothetical protein